MSATPPFTPVFDADLLRRVEQFYYAEARMLDERRYMAWLTLLSPDVRYVMPGHFVPPVETSSRDPESAQAIERIRAAISAYAGGAAAGGGFPACGVTEVTGRAPA